MEYGRPTPQEESDGFPFIDGVVFAALLSIPLWAAVAVAAIALFQQGPLTATQSAAFMVAAAVEAILLRYIWRREGLKARVRSVLVGRALPADRRLMIKQTAMLGGLVIAYLHYYFWDVNLQIAQLNRVTVFI